MIEEVSNELLELMACSKCKSNLNYLKEKNRLICVKCNQEFKIENGIPNMVIN